MTEANAWIDAACDIYPVELENWRGINEAAYHVAVAEQPPADNSEREVHKFFKRIVRARRRILADG